MYVSVTARASQETMHSSCPSTSTSVSQLSSAHLSELVSFVWKLTKSYEILIIDYKHSQVYGLWAETFDNKSNSWRIDREFCLDTPLKSIGLKP